MHEIEILKWIIGSKTCNTINIKGINEDWLVDLTHEHGLINRLLKKLVKYEPEWSSQGLKAKLLRRQMLAQSKTQNQINAIQEISNQLPDPLIVIQGISTYAITLDYQTIRIINNVNILYNDIYILKSTLLNKGYKIKPSLENEPIIMYKNDVVFNIYQSYPVLTYPKDLDLNRKELIFTTNIHKINYYLGYNDLIKNCTYSKVTELKDILFPNEKMAVLLLCIDVFNRYISAGMQSLGSVILGDLADLITLINQRNFNKKVFIKLVEKYNAQTTKYFVQHLFINFIGYNPLSSKKEFIDIKKIPFPQRLLDESGIWKIPNTTDELIYRDRYYNLKKNGLYSRYLCGIKEGKRLYSLDERLLYVSYSLQKDNKIIQYPNKLQPLLLIDWKKGGLLFRIKELHLWNSSHSILTIDFGKKLKWAYDGLNLISLNNPKWKHNSNISRDKSGFSFQVFIPWQVVSHKDRNSIYGYISLIRKETNNSQNMSSILLPINIINQTMNKIGE